jgi:two-component sensor histidine kinase
MREVIDVARTRGSRAADARLHDPDLEAARVAMTAEMRKVIGELDAIEKGELALQRARAARTKTAAFAGLFASMVALTFAAILAWRSRTIVSAEKSMTDAELAQMQAMLLEIHHRVKNNLQMISSLLSLQSRQSPHEGARSAFQDAQSRVRSMALLHESLYQSTDLARIDMEEYVNKLLEMLQHAYGEAGSTGRAHFQVAVEGIFLPVDLAVPCGLIVNELVTNALKHAFGAGEPASNEVRIEMKQVGEKVTISVADNGVGFADVDPASKQTMGLTLVRDLSSQLQGQVVFSSGADASMEASARDRTGVGAHCSITFPLPPEAAERGRDAPLTRD